MHHLHLCFFILIANTKPVVEEHVVLHLRHSRHALKLGVGLMASKPPGFVTRALGVVLDRRFPQFGFSEWSPTRVLQ